MNNEPAWLGRARALIGTREVAGAGSNPTILAWAKRIGARILGIAYTDDATAWCGLFVTECLSEAGIDLSTMKVGVRASAWASWGIAVDPARLTPGTILVFQRPGGGHVGFYVGEDATTYHVLGGNQGDAVSIARIAKGRCIARRWPKDVPITGKPVHLAGAAGGISENEA